MSVILLKGMQTHLRFPEDTIHEKVQDRLFRILRISSEKKARDPQEKARKSSRKDVEKSVSSTFLMDCIFRESEDQNLTPTPNPRNPSPCAPAEARRRIFPDFLLPKYCGKVGGNFTDFVSRPQNKVAILPACYRSLSGPSGPECPRECPRKWGVSEGVSDGVSPAECPKSVPKVSRVSGTPF